MAEKEVASDAAAGTPSADHAAISTSFSTSHWDTTKRLQATTLKSFTRKESPGLQWSAVVPGDPLLLITRTELAERRNTQRTPQLLAAFAQLTDLHITDVQSPAHMEYVHTRIRSAYRPNEATHPLRGERHR